MQVYILSRGIHLFSTQRLFQAAKAAGCYVEIIDYTAVNVVYAGPMPQFFYDGDPLPVPDVVIGRISPVYTPLGGALLAQFEQAGAMCVPSAHAFLLARNKWRTTVSLSRAGVAQPASAMLSDAIQLPEIAEAIGGYPLIIKLLESTHGSGVVFAPTQQVAHSVLDAFASLHKGVLVQKFVTETSGADVRVIVLGGRVVAAMTRTPKAGEFRSNLHRGGEPRSTQLSKVEEDAALSAAAAVGLEVAGVDFLRAGEGPLVLEVNASPGLEGIEAATGIDVAGAVVAHALKLFDLSG